MIRLFRLSSASSAVKNSVGTVTKTNFDLCKTSIVSARSSSGGWQ
jgi:hypothetical protein